MKSPLHSQFRLRQLLQASLLALLLTPSLPLLAQTRERTREQTSEQVKEQLVVALTSPGKPGSLNVKLVGGSINVVGYNGKDVVIEASARGERRGRSAPAGDASGMRRIDRNPSFDLTAEERDNKVYIKTNSWQQPIDLVIKVPQQFSLKIGTVQDGDIVVENVSGELEVSNVNGSVQLKQVSGSAVANTVNGSVVATFKNVTSGAPMAFSTVNGKVDVTFPANAKAAFKMKSDMGEIYSDFDLATEKSAPKVNKTAQGGTYRVSTDDWSYGKINGGGAEVMMKSLNGNLYIRKAK
ncbi:DUF4097 family beta strand repeat-containing protein [Hymenobacter sp. HDW8]|uniref:DUF4097 family beta strand repeat-containing protein n=1 Tax=Hymenobacter sp. HDW8 TaxID=2714932 RepID=UPI00140D6B04|nr:DUF4097 family beta strand repeat-containing protein [Hymenobacter sp. HDW8]QIL77075.1 DUF4097 domain-containing protein [Hymenobacter sp. HDW8]